MRILKKLARLLLALTFITVAGLTYLVMAREDIEPFEELYLPAQQGDTPAGALSIQFLGNTNLQISDGSTSILTDGWFSRPSLLSLTTSHIEPDRDAIAQALEQAGISSLDAVIPVHSHYDHAMDAPLVAEVTGAILIGSESTLNIGRGLDLPESDMRLAVSEQPMVFGEFSVTLIESTHYRFPGGILEDYADPRQEISHPLVPPVDVYDYKAGAAYSIHVQHPRGNLLIQASAGWVDGALDDVEADVLFLGVGGITGQSDEYQESYWQQVVHAVGPRQVIPIHWDSMTDPLAHEALMPTLLFSLLLDFNSARDLAYARGKAKEEGIEIALMPMWEPLYLLTD